MLIVHRINDVRAEIDRLRAELKRLDGRVTAPALQLRRRIVAELEQLEAATDPARDARRRQANDLDVDDRDGEP